MLIRQRKKTFLNLLHKHSLIAFNVNVLLSLSLNIKFKKINYYLYIHRSIYYLPPLSTRITFRIFITKIIMYISIKISYKMLVCWQPRLRLWCQLSQFSFYIQSHQIYYLLLFIRLDKENQLYLESYPQTQSFFIHISSLYKFTSHT